MSHSVKDYEGYESHLTVTAVTCVSSTFKRSGIMASGRGRYACHGPNRQMALISLLELQRETLVYKIGKNIKWHALLFPPAVS